MPRTSPSVKFGVPEAEVKHSTEPILTENLAGALATRSIDFGSARSSQLQVGVSQHGMAGTGLGISCKNVVSRVDRWCAMRLQIGPSLWLSLADPKLLEKLQIVHEIGVTDRQRF